MPSSEEYGEKCEKQPVSTEVRAGGRGATGAPAEIAMQPLRRSWWSRYPPCSSRRTSCWSRWTFPGGPTQKEGQCEKEGAAEKGCYRMTAAPQFPIPLHHSGIEVKRVRNKEVKLCPGSRGGGVNFCLCFPLPKSI